MRANDLIIIQKSITDKYSVFLGNISRDNLFRHRAEVKQVEIHSIGNGKNIFKCSRNLLNATKKKTLTCIWQKDALVCGVLSLIILSVEWMGKTNIQNHEVGNCLQIPVTSRSALFAKAYLSKNFGSLRYMLFFCAYSFFLNYYFVISLCWLDLFVEFFCASNEVEDDLKIACYKKGTCQNIRRKKNNRNKTVMF